MKVLFLKLLRDIKGSIGQFISIMFVIGIGTAFFTGLSTSVSSVDKLISNYYESQSLSDYSAFFRGLTSEELEILKEEQDITKLEARHTFNVTHFVNNSETELKIHTLTDFINKPYVYEGNLPHENEIALDRLYLEENFLKVGDRISFDYNGIIFDLRISGSIDSPEYVYKVKDAFQGNVDNKNFGVGYINELTIINKFNEKGIPYVYTDVNILSDNKELSQEIFKDISSFVKLIGRDQYISYVSFNGALEQIEKIVIIFPIIFFLVAAIITFISMSKTVENQRNQIGIMQSIGIPVNRIYLNYISYSFIAAFLGSLIGGMVGIFTIPTIILKTFEIQYSFPITKLELNPEVVLYGIFISLIFALASTVLSCYKTLMEVPAKTIRPKQPKKTKSMFIERMYIWKKLSFTTKIIIRNIFYNKMRLILSSIGVIGSIAFIITGFSLKASVDELISYEVRKNTYDIEVRMNEFIEDEEILKSYDKNIENVDFKQLIVGSFYTRDGLKEDVPINIVESFSVSKNIEDIEGDIIEFRENSVVIPHVFVEKYGFNIGDIFKLEMDLNGEIKEFDLSITDIGTMYSDQSIYISNDILKDNDINIVFNSAYLKLADPQNIEDTISNLERNENIDKIYLVSSVGESVRDISKIMNSVVFIIIIGSAVLAISVIYNITSINIFERVREIATLLVLGYYDREINKLIFIENIILAMFGGILGIPAGIVLFKYMNELISQRGANLPSDIYPLVIVSSFLTILIFSIFTNILLKKRVAKVNMIEALKGVE